MKIEQTVKAALPWKNAFPLLRGNSLWSLWLQESLEVFVCLVDWFVLFCLLLWEKLEISSHWQTTLSMCGSSTDAINMWRQVFFFHQNCFILRFRNFFTIYYCMGVAEQGLSQHVSVFAFQTSHMCARAHECVCTHTHIYTHTHTHTHTHSHKSDSPTYWWNACSLRMNCCLCSSVWDIYLVGQLTCIIAFE